MSACAKCNTPIEWITTTGGRKMPVEGGVVIIDPDGPRNTTIVTADGDVRVGQRMIDDGRPLVAGAVEPPRTLVAGREPHWASCWAARELRRPRGAATAAAQTADGGGQQQGQLGLFGRRGGR